MTVILTPTTALWASSGRNLFFIFCPKILIFNPYAFGSRDGCMRAGLGRYAV